MKGAFTHEVIGLVGVLALLGGGCEWESRSPDDAGVSGASAREIRSEEATARPAPDLVGIEPAAGTVPETIEVEAEQAERVPEIAFAHVDDPSIDHLELAQAHLDRGDRAAAMIELGKRIYHEPDDTEAAMLLGLTSWRNGDKELARKAYELVTEMEPGRVDAWLQLGRLAMNRGGIDEAADLARHAMSVDPKRAEPHNLMGRIWLSRSHWHRAVLSFKQAVALAPENRHFRNNLGYAYLMKKDFGRAVEVMEAIVESEDVPAYMLNNLGLAYEGAGRLQDATSSFKQAVEKNPRYINAKINLDRLQTLAKRAEQKLVVSPEEDWEQPLAEPEEESDDLIIVEPGE